MGRIYPAISRRLWRAVRRRFRDDENSIVFAGDHSSWEVAKGASSGYDAAVILDKTRESLLKVKRGEACFERDAVVFDRPEYPMPLLACLQRVALMREGSLSVVDFGGSLGSSYFQCRDFLEGIRSIRWSVVEQEHYVRCGKAEFEDTELKFYYSIDECLAMESPDVLLLSGVVQYLESPYEFVQSAVSYGIPYILVDRTAFVRRDQDLLTVERVPDWIYPASYPAWFLRETAFTRLFDDRYQLLATFPGADQVRVYGEDVYFRGFFFARSHATPTNGETLRKSRMRDEVPSGMDQHRSGLVSPGRDPTRPGEGDPAR